MTNELILFYPGELFQRGKTLSFETTKSRKDFPIKEIDSVFCFAQISFVSRVFDFLGNNGVPVFFFNYYGLLKGIFVPFNNELSSNKDCFKIEQVKTFIDKEKRLDIAKEFLISGIDNMFYLLEKSNIEKRNEILIYKEHLLSCKTVSELMLKEANMRYNYYRLLDNGIKNRDFEFLNRTYRPPKDPINALISFGNVMLYSFILAEIFKTDADPKISFLHEPQDNRYSLSFDIAEIFKPIIVDRFILQIVNKKIVRIEEHFEYIEGACYLNSIGKKIFLKYFLEFLDNTIMHQILHRKVSYKYLFRLEIYKLIKSI
ncbi:type I-B CRISPR-associated endonuclease Cas1, partial [bacterium]|nr:type I-B CRISPR-associated endonuclease Cas1 [bacterium]